MSYAVAIEALADPTRRKLVSRVRRRELTVGALARALRISQPAVSQHLARAEARASVRERREGTRHYFAAAASGLEPLRRYFESFWDDVLGAFAGRPARATTRARRTARKPSSSKAASAAASSRKSGEGRSTRGARVTAWDPPRRVAFTWHPGQSPETSQDVEVTFFMWTVNAARRLALDRRL